MPYARSLIIIIIIIIVIIVFRDVFPPVLTNGFSLVSERP